MTDTIAKAPPTSNFTLATDQWTEPFWTAAADHRLVVSKCAKCSTFRMPPTPFCPECLSQEIDWVEASGEGELFSYSIVVRPLIPSVQDSVPYVTAVVSLNDVGGVRLITNVVDVKLDRLHVGMALRVYWEDVGEGCSIPRFRAVPSA